MSSASNDGTDAIKLWQSHMSDEHLCIPDSDHPGDYSSRMDELFDDGEDEFGTHTDEEEEEQFVYTGVDADTPTAGYHDQLRDILGSEAGVDNDAETKAPFAEQSPTKVPTDNANDDKHVSMEDRVFMFNGSMGLRSATPSESDIIERPTVDYVQPLGAPRPFLHPSVSRLRSYAPGFGSQTPSDISFSSVATPPSAQSVTSHLSPISRESSPILPNSTMLDGDGMHTNKERQVFKWAELANLSRYFYSPPSQKVNAVLGMLSNSRPTVLASNGLICLGTEAGSVHVFDFKQTLKCVCGADINNGKEKNIGRVTALALSHDHTYVASGHSTGHIFLYNLSEPNVPARSILPTTLSAIASGRKEGHLQGSRIVNIGFIGGRHTAVVSADERGLAFYHNLGKVLFVEAFDTLRILGRYPEEGQPVNGRASSSFSKRGKPKFTLLALSPLPLGTSPHVTDNYRVIAMLTPTKLVVVGLRPSPKTWFKCPRRTDEGTTTGYASKWRGTLAWFPSSLPPGQVSTKIVDDTHNPTLVYSWGSSIHLIRVTERKEKQVVHAGQKGKSKEVEIGIIVYEEVCKWSAQEDVLSVQWLNANQIIVFTPTTLEVHDAHSGTVVERVTFDSTSLVNPLRPSIPNGDSSEKSLVLADNVAHSVRVYKGKIFLLCRDKLQVGTLMTWADYILSCVQAGDFLGAIELSRSYYTGEAPGNRNGLPLDLEERRNAIGERMRGLMRASAQYAFSEERLTDDTHVTPDHRGVDRTSLFEDLVLVSARACIALDDFDFLYEDLFQEYDEAGIARIYLLHLQPFILDNTIRYVPPRITQRLIALHEEDSRPDQIERVIWHIDPACLDINQVIQLCQKYHLYDALVYTYTCALRDYVAPIVEFLGIIRQKLRADRSKDAKDPANQEPFQHAYKIYPYLETILTGRIYPSNNPLGESEGLQAKKDVFSFLFSGRSCVWPQTDGQLVLTSLEEEGEEPTYPYVRQLLAFDSEWFLHSLDNAFEEAFLDEDLQSICRSITRILLEISSSNSLPSADATFIRIFIARNVPKYPQFLHVPTNALHSILIGLAEDRNPETREDRQLAAESLLSIYHPEDMGNILRLFTEAGFYRILRQRYLHDRRWSALLSTYLDDASLEAPEVVLGVNQTFVAAQTSSHGTLPPELMVMLESRMSAILDVDIGNTALLVDKYQPSLHESAINLLEDDFKRFQYLRRLLEPGTYGESGTTISSTMPGHLAQMYLSLQCRFEPKKVIDVLKTLPPEMLEWDQAMRTCESCGVYEAVVWGLNWRGDPPGAIAKVEAYLKQLSLKALNQDENEDVFQVLDATESVVRRGITICLEHSSSEATLASSQRENLWLQLFKSQIYCISGLPAANEHCQEQFLPSLRSLVQETFGALVSGASSKTVSFPRLFERLVESVSSSTGAHYTEFRSILTGMLESYRSDGDMLVITKHLVDRDVFDTMAAYARERGKGWAPSTTMCSYCRKPAGENPAPSNGTGNVSAELNYRIAVSRTGVLYHVDCSSHKMTT